MIHQMVVLPFRGTSTPQRNGQTETFMRPNKGKCKVLQLGRSNPRHQHMLKANKLEDSFAEEDPRILVDNNTNIN